MRPAGSAARRIAPPPGRPEVLVLGGGVIGAAVLFELALRGVRALLIERAEVGRESTGKSAAVVRMHYANAPVVRMALRSRSVFQNFGEITGAEPVYFETGWTYVVPEKQLEAVRATAEMNRREGVDVVEIGVEEASELYPGLSADGIGAIFLERESGFANPYATTVGFIEAARRLGATVRDGLAAHRLVAEKGVVVGVETDGGLLSCGLVVLAAGAWSSRLACRAHLFGFRPEQRKRSELLPPLLPG